DANAFNAHGNTPADRENGCRQCARRHGAITLDPEQPPTIPHSIVGYRIDKDSNKCLSCHSRANSARTQAVMISITHYMDRDGQPLAAVSPRRYFCVQCHVPQQDVKPLVDNRFENIDQILEKEAANAARKP
ncbi:nitrate reductase cytochrome c-type subunit, partial [Pseudomonas aeruginosa]